MKCYGAKASQQRSDVRIVIEVVVANTRAHQHEDTDHELELGDAVVLREHSIERSIERSIEHSMRTSTSSALMRSKSNWISMALRAWMS